MRPAMDESERVKMQSNAEWLQELITGSTVIPKCDKTSLREQPILRFISWRTTWQGRLVLELIDSATGEEVDAFFNVDIKRLRSKGNYPTGERGQFFPRRRCKFRKLWNCSVGQEPLRWSRVHKEMHKLKDIEFTGTLVTSYRSDGTAYTEVKDLEPRRRHT